MMKRVFFWIGFVCILSVIFVSLSLADEWNQLENQEDYAEEYYKARVIRVKDIQSTDDELILEQKLKVEVLEGKYKSKIFNLDNYYKSTNPNLNLKVSEGMTVVLVFNNINGKLDSVYLYDVARDRGLLYLLTIFSLLILIIGKKQGFNTLLTLVYTGVIIVKVMLPLLLKGYSPIITAVLSAIAIIIPALLVVGGFNYKSIAAIIGTAFGVVVAGIIALWIGKISYLTGFSSEEAHMLVYMEENINVKGLLFAGIIIGSLGAVTDVAMSIASAIAEVKSHNSSLGVAETIQVGINVGRDIMGTMSNTLLLAYVGGSIPLLLVLQGAKIPWVRIINMDIIATEFVSGLAGSIGLIAAIPVTALATAVLSSSREG